MAKLPRPLVSSHSRRVARAKSPASSCATTSADAGGSGDGDLPNIGRAYYGQPPPPVLRLSASTRVKLQPLGLVTVRSRRALSANVLAAKWTASCVAEATTTSLPAMVMVPSVSATVAPA